MAEPTHRELVIGMIKSLNTESPHCHGILKYLWREYALDDDEIRKLLMTKFLGSADVKNK